MADGNNIATLQSAGLLPHKHNLAADMVAKIDSLTVDEIKTLVSVLKKLGVTNAQAVADSLQTPAY